MNQLKRIWIWCKRIRHLNGFGVQSPFAYSFVHSIIYKKLPQETRRRIKSQRESSPYYITHPHPWRVEYLLYKLAVYNRPTFVIFVEKEFTGSIFSISTGSICPCFTFIEKTLKIINQENISSSGNIKYISGIQSSLQKKLRAHSSIDFAFVDLNTENSDSICDQLLNRCRQNSLLIIGNIHQNKKNITLWQQLAKDRRTALSFDLYTVGILLFDHHYHQQQYIINF